MKSQSTEKSLTALVNVLFWTVLFTYVLAVRFYILDSGLYLNASLLGIPMRRIFVNGVFLGVLVGLPYTIMEYVLKNRGIYQYSLWRVILNRVLIQFIITTGVLLLVAYMNIQFDVHHGLLLDEPNGVVNYFINPSLIFLFVGAFFGNLVLSVYRTLQMKIGEEIFWELLTGKFRKAREEERIFLFLDLKSSTTIAEKLGHQKYSYLIQDCFRDLHVAVLKSKARVYQYVGDEAVLTWPGEKAIHYADSIRCYFEFANQLKLRSTYYKEAYGIQPVFKGGLNGGKVMTAEVGVIKRDIAYHSDVLNTAARIEGLCNEKNAGLLASRVVREKVETSGEYDFVPRGEVLLRGKNQVVDIFEVLEKKF